MADPKLTILIVEAGGNNYADPTIINPALFLTHLYPGSKIVAFHKARRAEALGNREPVVPAGEILGGVSSCTVYGCWLY
jgi:alcohol oxidase